MMVRLRPDHVNVAAEKEKHEIFNVQIRSGDAHLVQAAELSYAHDYIAGQALRQSGSNIPLAVLK